MLYTGPDRSINTGPQKEYWNCQHRQKKVNPHDPDQAEQTADITRNEILSHYPQVEPQPDIYPVKDRSDSRVHNIGDAVCIHIHVWHSSGCGTPHCRVVIPLHKFPFFLVAFQSFVTSTPVSQAHREPVQGRWLLLHNEGAI